MKKIFLSVAVAATLMSCGGAQKQNTESAQNNDSEKTETVAEAPQESAPSTTTISSKNAKTGIMKEIVGKLDKSLFETGNLHPADFDKAMATAYENDENPLSCTADFNNGDGQEDVNIAIYPKKDGKNYFCAFWAGGGVDCYGVFRCKTFNYNAETGAITDEEADIEPVVKEDFGTGFSAAADKELDLDIKKNRLEYRYTITQMADTEEFYINVVNSTEFFDAFDENDNDVYHVAERYWDGEKFVKQN
ncbi:MAG: hypothetical protein MJZ61_05810 [Bacteroidales bacterium]|nr:hypothetical protein [Bacteroidales bacterium]